jgi:hypothetical protein
MPWVEIHMKISWKMTSTQGVPIYLTIVKATRRWEARRSSIVSTNPKTRRDRSLTTGRHTVGGAPPPEVILDQSQDNPEEWFLLGVTYALVVRKRRGLSRQIWRAYQDLKIPLSYAKEEANSKPARATREASTLQDLNRELKPS